MSRLRVNTAGMIPLIFAQSLLILPSTIASYFVSADLRVDRVRIANWFFNAFSPTNFLYWLLYFLFTVAFTYFYTDVMFRQQNLPETLQKQGGFMPGIRPGPRTEAYLNGVLQRITLVGALFLGLHRRHAFHGWGVCRPSLWWRRCDDRLQVVDHQQRRVADCRRCGAGHDEADRSAVADA